jgi:uncharacterized protein YbjT (DUF2867 family)
MSLSPTTVLVTGATGVQGTATIHSLVSLSRPSNPITIHAFVRDLDAAKAQSLTSLSTSTATIKLFKGTFDDVPSLTAAAANTVAAFINVVPSFDPSDPNAETRHANNILSALSSTPTIKRVVYSSVNGVADPSKPSAFKNLEPSNWMYHYFTSKFGIMEAVRKTAEQQGWDYTILKPATFLSNFLVPVAGFIYPDLPKRKIVTAFPVAWRLTYLDPEDIGRFAARVFVVGEEEFRKVWKGKGVPLGSVEMSLEEVIAVINKVLGLEGEEAIKVVNMSAQEAQELSKINLLVGSQLFQVDNPEPVDVEKVKSYGIELGGVEEFFMRNKRALEQTVGL